MFLITQVQSFLLKRTIRQLFFINSLLLLLALISSSSSYTLLIIKQQSIRQSLLSSASYIVVRQASIEQSRLIRFCVSVLSTLEILLYRLGLLQSNKRVSSTILVYSSVALLLLFQIRESSNRILQLTSIRQSLARQTALQLLLFYQCFSSSIQCQCQTQLLETYSRRSLVRLVRLLGLVPYLPRQYFTLKLNFLRNSTQQVYYQLRCLLDLKYSSSL